MKMIKIENVSPRQTVMDILALACYIVGILATHVLPLPEPANIIVALLAGFSALYGFPSAGKCRQLR